MATIKDTYQVDSKADTGGIRQAVGQLVNLRGALNGIKAVGAAPFRAIGGAVKAIGGGLGVLGAAVGGLKAAAEMVGQVTGALKEASPAFGSAMGRIEERLANFKNVLFANLGERLAPLFEKIADVLSSPAFDNFINGFMTGLVNVLNVVVPILTSFIDVLMAPSDSGGFWKLLQNLQKSLEGVIGKEGAQIFTDIVYVIKTFLEVLGGSVSLETFTARLDDMNEGGNTFWGVLSNVIKFLQENWPKVQAAFEQVGGKIGEIIGAVSKIIGDFIAEHGPEIQAFFENVVGKIGKILGQLFQVVMTILGGIAKFIDENQEEIKRVIETVWTIIKTSVETVLNAVSGIINAVLLALQGDWEGAWNQIKGVFEGVWNGFTTIVTNVWSLIKGLVASGINGVVDLINGLISEANKALAALNIPPITLLGRVSFAQGGIVSSPTAAVVGDNPRSPEAIAPLSDLLPMIRQAVGDAGGGQIVVNVYGPFGPGYTPYEAGQQAGQGIRDKLRAKGRV